MTFARKLAIIGLLCLLASLCPSANSQSTNQGNEIVLSGGSQTILTSVSASNLNQGTGTNTFIFTAGPNVSVSVYITNDTATACNGSLQVTVNTTGEPQINSLNQNLAQWQVVPILNQSTGAFSANSGLLSLVGNSTTVLKTAAIAGVKTAIQVNNTNAGCSTVTLDLAVVFTPVAITSPLINVSSSSAIVPGPPLTDVQGVVPQGISTGAVNPILIGGAAPPVNSTLNTVGFDNFSFQVIAFASNTFGTFTEGTLPVLQQSGQELAIAFNVYGGNSNTQPTNLLAPWVVSPSRSGDCVNGSICVASLTPASTGQILQRSYSNSGVQTSHTDLTVLLAFTSTVSGSLRQSNFATASSAAFTSNTLAGSTLLIGIACNSTAPCTGQNVTDTQGGVWKQVAIAQVNPGNSTSSLTVFVDTTPATAAADTVTATTTTGTIFSVAPVELSGLSVAGIIFPSTFNQVDPTGAIITRADAQFPNQFVCNVTLSTNTTTQCEGAPTSINGTPVRLYVTDVQVQTTTAGTATTIQLKTGTGTNCGTGTANLSVITYPNTAVGTVTFSGFRTPFITPQQTAVCATQAGTTAGTSIVEVHGFLAP